MLPFSDKTMPMMQGEYAIISIIILHNYAIHCQLRVGEHDPLCATIMPRLSKNGFRGIKVIARLSALESRQPLEITDKGV